jgi:nicotinate-nucleotide adenylyltransferase
VSQVGPAVAPPRPIVPGSLGILGGTFDPIHIGHLAVAEEVRERLGLERILFIPAARPPHKAGRPMSTADDRAAMVALAIAGNPRFELSRAELERPGPSYSVDTVAELRAAGGRAPDPWFILSAEAAAELPTWHEPRRLLSLCRLVVVPRGGGVRLTPDWPARTFPGVGDRFAFLDGPELAISGSTIRERIRLGRSIRYLVPDAVIAYIGDHGLYREDSSATGQAIIAGGRQGPSRT